ncbi:PadR family transcriptional regulator [Haloimpatiens sp. FM7330]|uniref:PadR family transcriptional regulator n=1 Tax=Haloimpatiens sp. FM7330 TaxID=3298610 RepID=UPI003643A5F0
MARQQFQNLTEPMYYILISLLQERCGVDIMKSVIDISKGRVRVGPGTLYTLLGKFEKEKMIIETKIQGRKRSYIITDKGKEILLDEYRRLITMVNDGEVYMEGEI